MSYSFLIEMAWKSAAISGAALLLVTLLRARSAADRGALLRVGLAMLLLLPIVSALFPSLVVETPAPAAAPFIAPAAASTLATEAPLSATRAIATEAAISGAGDWNDPGILFLILYLGGVLMVAGRLLAGLWTLRGWTAEAREIACPDWHAAFDRVVEAEGGRADRIRLLASAHARSPLSWGWRRPVILLDSDTLRHADDADAILAHEIAHVLRSDWPALIASRIAVALFWFNPLVWRLDREIVQHAEEAADSFAVARVERTRYAQTLLDWARESSGLLPANAMAATEPGLSRRVRALLDGRADRRSGSFWTFAAMAACAAVAAPVAALEFVPEPPEAVEPPDAPMAPPAPNTIAAAVAPSAVAPATAPTAPGDPAGIATPAPLAALAPLAAMTPATPPAPQPAPAALPAPAAMPAPAPRPAAAPQRPRIATLAALAFADRHPAPHIDEDAIAAEVEASVAEGLRHARRVRIDGDRIARDVQRATRVSLRHGAAGMAEGAREMERGADGMRRAAGKLRNRDYREREIAKAAARGKRVTHEELLEAAEGLEEGAEEMREGARDMREAAEEMRRGDS